MRTLVVGDIHGAHLALKQCLERCNFSYEEDRLIVLGDIVDGWSGVYDVVEELLKMNTIYIIGNHDEWFIDYINTGMHPCLWNQGGQGTAVSYLREIDKEDMIERGLVGWRCALNPGDIPDSHKRFFRSFTTNYKIQTEKDYICFVHGGFDRDYNIDYQHPSILMWDRALWDQAQVCTSKKLQNVDGFTKIFIGHTHVDGKKNVECLPLYRAGVWNLDTGAGWSGKLTIMDVNTEEYWQSDLVTELYPDELGRRN